MLAFFLFMKSYYSIVCVTVLYDFTALITATSIVIAVIFYLSAKGLNLKLLLVSCPVKPLHKVSQPNSHRCQLHLRNLTIHIDSFWYLNKNAYIDLFMEWKNISEKCPPLPGGGVCKYVVDDKCADGIFFSVNSEVNFKKQHPDQIVISFTLEAHPEKHRPHVSDIKVNYERSSDIPVPYICERPRALWIYNMGQPEIPKGRQKIVGVISNCVPKLRSRYIAELMEHIAIDQIGKCFGNTNSDFFSTRMHGNWEELKLEFLRKSHYRYILAFENQILSDYVTEKVFHGLLTGVIPIYYGDRSVFDYIPGNHTIIYAPDYTPKQLAEYINKIDNDEELYASFFKNWDLKKMLSIHELYCHDHFMCRVCRKALEVRYHQEGCTNVKLMEKI